MDTASDGMMGENALLHRGRADYSRIRRTDELHRQCMRNARQGRPMPRRGRNCRWRYKEGRIGTCVGKGEGEGEGEGKGKGKGEGGRRTGCHVLGVFTPFSSILIHSHSFPLTTLSFASVFHRPPPVVLMCCAIASGVSRS